MAAYLYVHVMKTGGTTLVSHLKREFGDHAVYPNRELDRRFQGDVDSYMNIGRVLALPVARRQTLSVFTGHFPYMIRDLLGLDLTTLTILREPVERTISILQQLRLRSERYDGMSIEQIYNDEDAFRYFVHNHQTKIFCLVPSDEPRAILKPITIDSSRFALATKNLGSIDVVGTTEHFDDFMRELQRRFGWWSNGVDLTKRTNVTSESAVITRSFRRRITADNAYDLELYELARTLAIPIAREA